MALSRAGFRGPPRFLPSFVASSGGGGGEPASNSKAKSSLGTAASGGAVFQKSRRATNPEKKSIGSTATVELTMLAEAPPRTELPTVASAFCVAHISPSDLPAALRDERLACAAFGDGHEEQLCKTRQQ